MTARQGASLIELIVALTVFAVGLLGLAAVAAVAHRSFNGASAVERAAETVAQVSDSLLRVATPVSGERRLGDVLVQWQVEQDSTAEVLLLTASTPHIRTYRYTTVHRALPR